MPTNIIVKVSGVPAGVTPTYEYSYSETDKKKNPCGVAGNEHSCVVYRTRDTTKLVGWIYECDASCDTIANGKVIIWDAKRKAAFMDDVALSTLSIGVIGKKQTDAEWVWSFSGTADYPMVNATQGYELTGAGLGKFSVKNGRYTSFSGRVVGKATASWDLKTKKNNCCISSQVSTCDGDELIDGADTVVFGTWSVKYDASASKRYAKDGYLKIPSYAK